MFQAYKIINKRIAVHVLRRKVSTIGPKIESKEELKKLLATPTWRLLDLIEETPNESTETQISPITLNRILKLSGFDTNISEEREQSLIKSLNLQMKFIKHLYKDEHDFTPKEESNESNFRLMESDHRNMTPITFENLRKAIERLPEEIDPEKGEIPESFKVGHLSTEKKKVGDTILKINLK